MEEVKRPKNFIEEFIEEDMRTKEPRVQTRFPPEPNGYLHIGHAKAIAIDFGMAERFGGICNLSFDDTNPAKEDVEYVDAIQADIQWLGFRWNEVLFGSSYFDQCYDLAVKLIQKGVAYVDELTKEDMRAYRGTLTQAGKNSPYRDRPVAENLDLFERMRAGEFEDGSLDPPREDRHGVAEHQHARSRAVSHQAREPSSDGRQVVHLPDV